MDTIAQGSTQTYIMDDGNSLDLVSAGVADYALYEFGLAANEVTGQVLNASGVVTLGPFWVQTTVKITATLRDCMVGASVPLPAVTVANAVTDTATAGAFITGQIVSMGETPDDENTEDYPVGTIFLSPVVVEEGGE